VRKSRKGIVAVIVVPLGLMVATVVTLPGAHAAFSATATNESNEWTAGTVKFGPNDPVGQLINISGLVPGSTVDACVKLTYTGTLSAPVKVYLKNADLGGTGLATYLTLQINEGTGESDTCDDFALGSNIYNATGMTDVANTLTAFNTATENYGNGVGAWTATTISTTKTYQILWTMQDDNAAVSKTATATFTWEAQNS